jgi:hypothetical protein
MPVVVATRMKVRRWRDLPAFMRGSMAAARQAEYTPGFLAGQVRMEAKRVFWTLTVWQCPHDMVAVRDSGVHAAVAPRLAGSASEGYFGTWESATGDAPSWQNVSEMVAESANFAPLHAPTESHLNKHALPVRAFGLDRPLRPRRSRSLASR